MNDEKLNVFTKKAAVTDTLLRYLDGLDARNWGQITELLSKPFHLQAAMLNVDQIIQPEEYLALGPKRFLPGFDFTSHICSNTKIVVENNNAHLKTKLLACHHVKPSDADMTDSSPMFINTIYCNMHMNWEGWFNLQDHASWLINKIRMDVVAIEGDPKAFDLALERASKKPE